MELMISMDCVPRRVVSYVHKALPYKLRHRGYLVVQGCQIQQSSRSVRPPPTSMRKGHWRLAQFIYASSRTILLRTNQVDTTDNRDFGNKSRSMQVMSYLTKEWCSCTCVC